LKDFINLGLASPLLDALAKQGYKKPTPIQIKAIPPALEGKDILGTAQTGTGKTAAFTLPILQQILPVLKDKNKRPIRVLILTPTRELAIQIHENISHYGSQTKVFHSVIFGGVGQKPQTDALRRGVDIITATPGRLLDLMNQGYVNLSRIEHFVLDEADRMLDMGFIHDVKKIFSKIPSKRQTLLFSATMPKEVLSLSNFLLKDPIRISVAPVSATAEKVNQKVFFVDQKSKRLLLKSLLKNDKIDISSVLVFTRTKHGANRVVKDLTKNNITAQAIHGNKSQNARQNALDNFKKRITRVLVATDIAARGIDIDDLSHVINYDIPNIPETYVHRIGRTGRAGNSGIAWSFVDTEERKYLSDIQKLIKKEIEIEINHEFLPQSNAGTEKRVQKSKRNSSNEKNLKKINLRKCKVKKSIMKKSHLLFQA
jgi:ATP-dependent RNA helicase RhlE